MPGVFLRLLSSGPWLAFSKPPDGIRRASLENSGDGCVQALLCIHLSGLSQVQFYNMGIGVINLLTKSP